MKLHLAIGALLLAAPAWATERATVLHTNDWQSYLTGVGPDGAFTPGTTGDDTTVGGVARLATLVDTLRQKRSAEGPVFLLDGGDVTMGTLFHTVTRETGSELQLMRLLAYDGVTLGNHEFDFRPGGFGQMVASAERGVGLPPLVATNLDLTSAHPDLKVLADLYARGVLERTRLIERDGLKVGLIGILGVGANEVMEAGTPVKVSPPVDAARAAVDTLRGQGAELVVVMSHSGVRRLDDGTWGGEEVDLMAAVPGIDVIVGGHSHTALEQPIYIGGRPILQAGSDTQYLGELRLERADGRWKVAEYTLHRLDDQIPGRPDVTARIETVKAEVDARVLAPLGYKFDQVIGEVEGQHGRGFEDHVIGNLVTDGMRAATGADVAVTGNGTLRADLFAGQQTVADIFRVSGLGVGTVDDAAGYPLVKGFVDGPSLKSVLEFLLIGYTLKGPDYYPRLSGVRVEYNPWRVPFDRIVKVELGDEARGYREVDLTDEALRVSVTTSTYVAKFLPQVKQLSYGLLDAAFLDAQDTLVPPLDLKGILVDAAPNEPGLQELKDWRALVDYVASRPDLDGDGVPNLQTSGPVAEARLLSRPSLAPSSLWGNATWRMWGATALAALALYGVFALGRWAVRRLRHSAS
jgi:5'-nucleotidase